jgi:hypothetical protein
MKIIQLIGCVATGKNDKPTVELKIIRAKIQNIDLIEG